MLCDFPSPDPSGDVQAPKAPLLDSRTELTHGKWMVSIYPDAYEAVIVGACPHLVGDDLDWPEGAEGDGDYHDRSAWSDLDEKIRQQKNEERATRRARTLSRRYMVSNRLYLMWVLTFAGEGLEATAEGRRECMAHVARFAARLKKRFGVMPYWYSPEIHPNGHGWHVNFFVGKRLPHAEVRELWGHGHVFVSDWTKKRWIRRQNLPFIEAVRKAAAYGCKYAQKDWNAEVLDGGAHRYELAQGYKPKQEVLRVASLAEAVDLCILRFRKRPSHAWSSNDAEDWDGPPVLCLTFTPRAGPDGGNGVDGA